MTGARIVCGSLVALAIALGCGCSRGSPEPRRAATVAPALEPEGSDLEPLSQKSVLVYFPSISENGLVGERREIVPTATAGDQAKQILSALLEGPAAGSEAAAALPAGTKLRQVYVLQDGTVYADFSSELRSAIDAGTDSEILTVYSIVNSIALNVPRVSRVAILVEGQPCETLNGHLDLRRPLPPDRKLMDNAEIAPPPDSDV